MDRLFVSTFPAALLAMAFSLPAEAQGPDRKFVPPPLASLIETADADGDGAISRAELAAIDVFAKLDVNQDGKVDASDVDNVRFFHSGGPHGGFLLRAADEDQDGKLSRADWQIFVAGADSDGDGILQTSELRSLMPLPPVPPAAPEAPQPPDAPRASLAPGAPAPLAVPRPPLPPAAPRPPLPPPLPELDAAELAAMFERLDANKDGVLEAGELPPSRMMWRQRMSAPAGKSGRSGG